MSRATARPRSSRSPRLRRVAIITGTRAEFGLLESLLRALRDDSAIKPQLIVTGMHLLPKFGRTIDAIAGAGWPIAATVPMQSGSDDDAAEALAVGRGVSGIACQLDRLDSQAAVVLGDRIEAFAGACAAATGRRLLVHIHGGDRAVGDVDDALRAAITRLAHLHYVASQDAQRRLLRMGEEAWRIHRVGAPGIDDIRRFRTADDSCRIPESLKTLLKNRDRRPYAVVVQHAFGRPPSLEAAVLRRIGEAVEQCGLAGVALYPNSDPGHEGILKVLRGLQRRPGWHVIASLPRREYLQLVGKAAVMIGNSSSGIIESASIGVNAVNIGPRQAGRLRCGSGVIDAREDRASILHALRRAIRRPRPSAARSVYGDGQAGRRMARLLSRIRLSPRLLQKQFTY